MMDEKKKHGEGKEVLENDFKEQKEVLQALQRDINNSNQKITRIELGIERTNFVDYWYVAGGVAIAAGFAIIGAIIGISISFSPMCTDSPAILGHISVVLLGSLLGFLILVAGALMMEGAYLTGTDLKKYPFELSRKELWYKNKRLFSATLLVTVFLILAIGLLFSILSLI
jgi:hypothetical protein